MTQQIDDLKKNLVPQKTINDRPPNFRSADGRLYLIRCFNCDPKRGRENWGPAVASGQCAWCGWQEEQEQSPDLDAKDTR